MWKQPSFKIRPLVLLLITLQFLVILVSCSDQYTRADFPDDFVFGAGTSAYQVEGAAFEDGRTPGIWDTLAHDQNKPSSFGGGNGDVACDMYHKYKEDVQHMAEIGLEAFRFSISWSRLIPNGRGPVNPKGLQYYNHLINQLILHGIQPHATLYHIDTPQVLEDEYAGWLSRKMVRDFTAYADVCFKEFGDRVLYWTTLNEANVQAIGGYDNGLMPPIRCTPPFAQYCPNGGNSSTEPYIAARNMLLGHSSAVKLYNKKYKAIQHGFVGLNLYTPWFSPDTNAEEDVIATHRAIDFYIGWLLHPLVYGDYPDIVKKNAGERIPALTAHESKLMKGSFDFIGLNHYSTLSVRDNPESLNMDIRTRDITADMGATVLPSLDVPPKQMSSFGLYRLLEYLKKAYGNPPTYIHENGVGLTRNGTLNDTTRVMYVHDHIGTLLDALRNGANTKGYFYWSFLDGFELFGGFNLGFGLYYVDLDDKELRRYPKLSAHWYSNFLRGTPVGPNDTMGFQPEMYSACQ